MLHAPTTVVARALALLGTILRTAACTLLAQLHVCSQEVAEATGSGVGNGGSAGDVLTKPVCGYVGGGLHVACTWW